MATSKDLINIAKIRDLLAQINNLVGELGSEIHVKFETMERTLPGKHYPTQSLYLKADERRTL